MATLTVNIEKLDVVQEIIVHLIEQTAALRQQVAWQPIETASKDGTAILCYEPGCGMAVVSWKPRHNHPTWRDDHGATMHPTHWMKLPDPPTEGESLANPLFSPRK